MAYIRLVGMDQCNANSFSETEEDDRSYERTVHGPVKLTSRQYFFSLYTARRRHTSKAFLARAAADCWQK